MSAVENMNFTDILLGAIYVYVYLYIYSDVAMLLC